MIHDDLLCGGCVWMSPTYVIYMLSLAGDSKMMLISDPRRAGSMARVEALNKWTWTIAELREKFTAERSTVFNRGWTYEGKLCWMIERAEIDYAKATVTTQEERRS